MAPHRNDPEEPLLDDAGLARQASDQPSAFAELYRRHFTRVYRYHYARTGNIHDAQDLTAQTFVAALEGIGSYQERGCFIAWLMGIAHNKMALHFRSRKAEVPLEAAMDLPHPDSMLEEKVAHRIQIAQISQLLHTLTPERAEALLLCIFSDLTAAEAGRVMGKSEAAVKMLVFRGLRDLREKMTLAKSSLALLALQEEI
jgi:RNA polymerase sigma-70 factor (ECF subfamily)